MTKIDINPYYSKFFYRKSLQNFFLQNHIYSFSDFPRFFSVTFSINIPKGVSTSYNITRSFYLLYVLTGSKPFFSKNKRVTTTTVIAVATGRKIFSFMSFFFFLSNSEKFRMMSPSSSSSRSVNFSFHDPSAIFDFRDCRFDYHNFPFKIRVSFVTSGTLRQNRSFSKDFDISLLLHSINFPRFFLFLNLLIYACKIV